MPEVLAKLVDSRCNPLRKPETILGRSGPRNTRWWPLLLLTVLPAVVAQSVLPIQSFEARFGVYRYGLALGEAFLTLAVQPEGRYSMRLDIRPNALLSWLFSEQVEESTFGELKDGAPRPFGYQRARVGDEPSRVKLSFDWEQERVQAEKNHRQTSFPLQPRLVDPLSWYLLVMSDLRNGSTPSEYGLVVGDNLKTYQIQRGGEATIETPLGELTTVMITRQRQGRETAIKLWLAPQLAFLPVQIAKIEQGEETWRMTIEELKGIPLPGTPGSVR